MWGRFRNMYENKLNLFTNPIGKLEYTHCCCYVSCVKYSVAICFGPKIANIVCSSFVEFEFRRKIVEIICNEYVVRKKTVGCSSMLNQFVRLGVPYWKWVKFEAHIRHIQSLWVETWIACSRNVAIEFYWMFALIFNSFLSVNLRDSHLFGSVQRLYSSKVKNSKNTHKNSHTTYRKVDKTHMKCRYRSILYRNRICGCTDNDYFTSCQAN